MLSKNPERILRKKKPIELSLKEADFDKRQKESLTNPTPEMERILGEMEALEKLREQMRDLDQLQEFNKQRTTWLKERWQSLEEAEVCIKIVTSTLFSHSRTFIRCVTIPRPCRRSGTEWRASPG